MINLLIISKLSGSIISSESIGIMYCPLAVSRHLRNPSIIPMFSSTLIKLTLDRLQFHLNN